MLEKSTRIFIKNYNLNFQTPMRNSHIRRTKLIDLIVQSTNEHEVNAIKTKNFHTHFCTKVHLNALELFFFFINHI